ncbi:hypothetical protein [Nocardioides sp. KR10-350]|uniref:hypothetical protein n=1 Tax=Nocardioides cheoyonin TaxID=3156615 RepID=UPI0032B52494
MWGDRRGERRGSRRRGSLVGGALGVAAIIIVTVVLGLAGTGGVYALWDASATAPGATITTGSIGLTVAGRESAVLTGLDGPLAPGAQVSASVTLHNTGSVPLSVGVASTTGSAPLADALTLRAAAVPVGTSCPTSAGTTGALVGYVARQLVTLPADGSEDLCLVLALDGSAPVTLAGTSADLGLTITGDQA